MAFMRIHHAIWIQLMLVGSKNSIDFIIGALPVCKDFWYVQSL